MEPVWETLEIGQIIGEHLKKKKVELDDEPWIPMMVVNKLSDPTSKLGIFGWLSGVYGPGHGFSEAVLREELSQTEQLTRAKREVMKFYRARDYLRPLKETLEKKRYFQLHDLFSLSVDLVFYDLTSSYFEGEGPEGLAARGYWRDHEPGNNQVVIGLLMCNGMPIGHEGEQPGGQENRKRNSQPSEETISD